MSSNGSFCEAVSCTNIFYSCRPENLRFETNFGLVDFQGICLADLCQSESEKQEKGGKQKERDDVIMIMNCAVKRVNDLALW